MWDKIKHHANVTAPEKDFPSLLLKMFPTLQENNQNVGFNVVHAAFYTLYDI